MLLAKRADGFYFFVIPVSFKMLPIFTALTVTQKKCTILLIII